MTTPRLSATDAITALREGALLIDVRSAAGRARNGEIEGAIIIAKSDAVPLLSARLGRVAPGQKLVLFCGSVAGTEGLVNQLSVLGIPEVYDVDGGFAALTAAGLQVIARPVSA